MPPYQSKWMHVWYNEDYGAQILEVDNADKPTLMKYLLTQIPHKEDETQPLKELYPNGFNTSEMTSCCIVAATNDRVSYSRYESK